MGRACQMARFRQADRPAGDGALPSARTHEPVEPALRMDGSPAVSLLPLAGAHQAHRKRNHGALARGPRRPLAGPAGSAGTSAQPHPPALTRGTHELRTDCLARRTRDVGRVCGPITRQMLTARGVLGTEMGYEMCGTLAHGRASSGVGLDSQETNGRSVWIAPIYGAPRDIATQEAAGDARPRSRRPESSRSAAGRTTRHDCGGDHSVERRPDPRGGDADRSDVTSVPFAVEATTATSGPSRHTACPEPEGVQTGRRGPSRRRGDLARRPTRRPG